MRILSATEAISPAIARTKLILFKPFRPGRTWKLAATGYLGGMSSVFLPFPLIYLICIPIFRRADAPSSVITALVITVAVMMTIYLAIFYLGSRLRFAFFDIVLHRGEFVAPAWTKYGSQSGKWTLFKLAVGLVFLSLLAIPLYPIAQTLIATFTSIHFVQGQDPPPAFMGAIFTVYGLFFALYIVIGLFTLANSLMSDFIVPSLALENTTLAEAFHRLGRLLRNEPGAVCFYALMKFVLFLAGGMAVGILFYVFLFAVLLVAAILGGIGYFLLHLLHVPQDVMIVLAIIAGIALYLFVFIYGMFLANGTLYTMIESYAMYFLGGRYPLLGNLLDRSTPPPDTLPIAPRSGYVPLSPAPPATNTP